MEKNIKFEMPLFGMVDSTLDYAVSALQSCKSDEIRFYIDFLGHRLYSDTVTLEGAYQEIYNMSREEYRESLREIYRQNKEINQKHEMPRFKGWDKVEDTKFVYPYPELVTISTEDTRSLIDREELFLNFLDSSITSLAIQNYSMNNSKKLVKQNR